MLLGDGPLGDLPLGGSDTSYLNGSPDVVRTILRDPSIPRSWLMRASPRDESTSTDPVTTIDVDLSTDGHRGHITDTDTIQYRQALINPYTFEIGLDNLWGIANVKAGEITIPDARGDYRSLCLEDWIGRNLDIHLGPQGGRDSDFARVSQLRSLNRHYDRTSLTLIVDDFSQVFNNPIQTNRYAGTGGLNGDNELKGVLVPLALGLNRQIEPILVDATQRIYQVNDGEIESIFNLEDNGTALVFNTDVADIEAGGSPTVGRYNTSLATGHIRLGNDPSGVLTCDVKGYKSSTYGYVDHPGPLIKLVVIEFTELVDPDNLDLPAFDAITSTYNLGIYVAEHVSSRDRKKKVKPSRDYSKTKDPDDVTGGELSKSATVGDVLGVSLQSSCTYVCMKPDKQLSIGQITNPDSITPSFNLDAQKGDIVSWRAVSFGIPIYWVVVGYQFYAKPLEQGPNVLTTKPTNEKQDREKSYRFVDAIDNDIKTQIPNARKLTILTNIDRESDAQDLADTTLALRSKYLDLVEVVPRLGLIEYGIGTEFSLTDTSSPRSPLNLVIMRCRNVAGSVGNHDEIVWECLAVGEE